MTNEQKIELLRAGLLRLELGDWHRGCFFADDLGEVVCEDSDKPICSYCAAGAVRRVEMVRVGGWTETPEYHAVLDELVIQVHIEEPKLQASLMAAWRRTPDSTVFAPLTVVAHWNDQHANNKEHVLVMYRNAITRLEAANG